MATEDNTAVVRGAVEAFSRGDFDDFLAFFHPEVEVSSTVLLDAAGPYRGHQGVREWVEVVFGHFDEVRLEPLEMLADGPRVIVDARVHVRGKASGVPVSREVGYVMTIREGKIAAIRTYPSGDEAREAAELSR